MIMVVDATVVLVGIAGILVWAVVAKRRRTAALMRLRLFERTS